MKYQGLNLTNLKNINRAKIVRLLNDRGNLSRKDIAAALNLTPAAVTQICSELLSEGVLVEKGEVREERRAGRRKINIGINENYGMILAVDFLPGTVTLTLCSVSGEVVRTEALSGAVPFDDPDKALQGAASHARKLFENYAGKSRLIGVGVTVPGTVDRETGVCEPLDGLWNREVDLGRIFSREFSVPLIFRERHVALTDAEVLFGAGKNSEILLILYVGTYVSSVLVVQQKVSSNGLSQFGDIGRLPVDTGAGTRELLTDYAARVFGQEDLCRGEFRDILVEKVGNYLCVCRPDRIILTGPAFAAAEHVAAFEQALKEKNPSLCEVEVAHSEIEDKEKYIGAFAAVFRRALLAE